MTDKIDEIGEADEGTTISHGSAVVMYFSITLEDGTVAETTENGDPLYFVMGDETMIEGLELALFGLKAGDKQSLKIDPETAYGYPDPENIHPMALGDFPDDMEIATGMIVNFAMPDEEEYPGMIKEIGSEQVTVDFNHPLAGHEIVFEVEILEVSGGDDEPVVLQ